jgi:hypothetical protein
MYKIKQKIILSILIFVCVGLTTLFCANDFAFADDTIRQLEIEYPTIPEAETPGADPDKPTTLPEYIKYLFNFGIAIGGILAFLVLVFGGFLWMTSAGDPTAIGKAKTKMFGGIIGLCLLLGSWIIIGMIDPDLKHLKEIPDMLGKTGVYLCETDADCEINDTDKRKRYSGSIPKFPGDLTNPDDFNAKKACFISKKDELMYLFVHKEEGYKGNIEKEIENTKVKDEDKCCGDISGGRSLSFLWNRPGIYLYQEPDFVVVGTDKAPEYLRGSAKTLKEWDNITQSIKIRHPSSEKVIMGYLFSEPDYSGQCAYLFDGILDWKSRYHAVPRELITKIGNLDGTEKNGKSFIKGTLSSIYTFTLDILNLPPKGEVVFYDQQNCKGNKFIVPMEGGEDDWIKSEKFSDYKFEPSGESAEGEVRSFRINGPYIVTIRTSHAFTATTECQTFTKPNASNCYDSVVASNIYSQSDDKLRPRFFVITPTN